jgi:hypothetical protein
MAPFQQIPKNFRFKPIYPISSSPWSHDVFSILFYITHVTKLSDESPTIIVYEDLTWKDLKKKLYEGTKRFQDVWIAKLSWAKFIIDDKDLEHQVRCKICTYVEGKEKLLILKLDTLLKHGSHKKMQSIHAWD